LLDSAEQEKGKIAKSHSTLQGNYDLLQLAYNQVMERISNDSEKQKVTDEKDIKRLTDEITRLKSEL